MKKTKEDIDIQIKSLIGEKEFQNYKRFAFRDDMFKLAIGVILGNSFNKVVYGISDLLVMPIFKFILVNTGESWRKWTFKPVSGLEFEIGQLLGVFVDFILISTLLYLLYSKVISRISKEKNDKHENTKECKYCFNKVNEKATKCPLCTGDLNAKSRRNRAKNNRTKNNRSK